MEEIMINSSMDARLRPTHALKGWSELASQCGTILYAPRPIGEWVEAFLESSIVAFEPPLWTEHIRIFSPYLLVPVNGVTWDTQNSALREMNATDGQAAFRSDTGKTYGRC